MPTGVYKRDAAPPLTGGVYALVFDGKIIYIGSTNCLKRRKRSHFHALSRGRHENYRLQEVATIHHFGSITFEVLESLPVASIVELRRREQAWIDDMQPECNIYRIAS